MDTPDAFAFLKTANNISFTSSIQLDISYLRWFYSILGKIYLQAEDGIGLPEEILEQANYENAARFYFLFIRFDFLWTLNYFALIALNFFEVSKLSRLLVLVLSD